MGKKFKIRKIGGVEYAIVSYWEQQEQAIRQGFTNILPVPDKKAARAKRRVWLSGRPRYQRYDGIFQF